MSDKHSIDVSAEIKTLIEKAAKAEDSGDAMRFSQAACNAANAMACVSATDKSGS